MLMRDLFAVANLLAKSRRRSIFKTRNDITTYTLTTDRYTRQCVIPCSHNGQQSVGCSGPADCNTHRRLTIKHTSCKCIRPNNSPLSYSKSISKRFHKHMFANQHHQLIKSHDKRTCLQLHEYKHNRNMIQCRSMKSKSILNKIKQWTSNNVFLLKSSCTRGSAKWWPRSLNCIAPSGLVFTEYKMI